MNLSLEETAYCLMATAACMIRLGKDENQIFIDRACAIVFKGVLLRNKVEEHRAEQIVRNLFGVINR